MKKLIVLAGVLALVAGCDNIKFPVYKDPLTQVNEAFPHGDVKHLPVYDDDSVWLVKQPDGTIYLATTYNNRLQTNIVFQADAQ